MTTIETPKHLARQADRPDDSIHSTAVSAPRSVEVALLTGGDDRPYVYGLTLALTSKGVLLDMIGSDELDLPEFRNREGVQFLNLRGDLRPAVSFTAKVSRVLKYYARLIRYAARSKPKIFHILWNNKFETLDRTLLMLYYKLLGKRIVFTAHNVNQAKRDNKDSAINRLTLRIQYRLSDHIFVHTEKMKSELMEEFGVGGKRATVIPFGINNSVPCTTLTSIEAKRRLGIRNCERALLFYGRIAPSKGLEYLVTAFRQISARRNDYRLIIAGRPDQCDKYWLALEQNIDEDVKSGRVLLRAEFVPDGETELYFKAADVLVLPYTDTYQSGVLFLAHNFGLPVIASDVGCLREEIAQGKTGLVFRPKDPDDLAAVLEQYFTSELYANLDTRRQEIRVEAASRHSWEVVSQATMRVYAELLQKFPRVKPVMP